MTYFTNGMKWNPMESDGIRWNPMESDGPTEARLKTIYNFYLSTIPVF